MIKSIKVLNVAQPNAHNIAHNGKTIENRTKPVHFRGTIAIYASKTVSHERFESQMNTEVSIDECAFGCIIAFADLVDCVVEPPKDKSSAIWFHGPYGYVLENIIPLKNPIEVQPPKGAIIWWTLEGEPVTDCFEQAKGSKLIPIFEVDAKTAPKAAPNKKSKKAKLVPSHSLGKIIGADVTNFADAIDKMSDYIDEHGLYDDESGLIKIDAHLSILFPKSEYKPSDIGKIILENLEFLGQDQAG